MAARENKSKQSKKTTKKRTQSSGFANGVQKVWDFVRSERGRKTAGLLLILFSLILLVSIISHFFTGHRDQDLVEAGGMLGDPAHKAPANWLGSAGAWLGQVFVTRGFGLMSLLIPVFTAVLGLAILENNYYRWLWRAFGLVLFATLWGSVFLSYMSYVFNAPGSDIGGGFGWYLNSTMFNYVGSIGMVLAISVSLLIFMVLNFNLDFPVSGWIAAFLKGKPQAEAEVDAETEAALQNEGVVQENEVVAEVAEPETKDEENPDEGDFVISVKPVEGEGETETEGDQQEDENNRDETEDQTKEEVLKLEPVPICEDDNADKSVELDPNVEVETPVSEGNGLELVIESNPGEPEVEPSAEGDNIFKTEEDTYEKIIPEDHQEVLDDEDDVGDWEEYDPTRELSDYQYPTIELLTSYDTQNNREVNRAELEENKNRIVTTLQNYKIEITSIKATIGPTVTLYEIVPAPGIRISKIRNLEDDIALSLAALGIRIIAPIPGKGTIGIEIPNSNPEIVSMRSVLATEKFRNTKAELPIALGKTISNEVYIADLSKMPHVLIAGATGQGKSVGINGLISSILFKKHPSQVKFVLIDPKKVELNLYALLEKHFLAKLEGFDESIITDTKQVIHVLNSLCNEMDQRYDLLKKARCRNLREYNEKFVARRLNPKKGHRYMPYIVLIIDEFADLMMTAGREIETPIARLAQLARAIGIHLVLATQRPSVNVITGIIKANFPARISFRVTSKVDSRTILDAGGADQLIGRGDLLFSTGADLIRVQNSFIDTPEVEDLVNFIAGQRGYPEPYYLPEVQMEGDDDGDGLDDDEDRDDMFEEAARLIVKHQQGSTSLIQRRLKLGYNRAGRIVDQLERAGVVGPNVGSKAREVLVQDEYALEQLLNNLE